MATATERRAERAQAHQIAQAALSSLVASAIAAAWLRLFDRHDLRGSQRRLAVAVEAIVQHYGRGASAAVLTHYRNERRAQGVNGTSPGLRQSPPLAAMMMAG